MSDSANGLLQLGDTDVAACVPDTNRAAADATVVIGADSSAADVAGPHPGRLASFDG